MCNGTNDGFTVPLRCASGEKYPDLGETQHLSCRWVHKYFVLEWPMWIFRYSGVWSSTVRYYWQWWGVGSSVKWRRKGTCSGSSKIAHILNHLSSPGLKHDDSSSADWRWTVVGDVHLSGILTCGTGHGKDLSHCNYIEELHCYGTP